MTTHHPGETVLRMADIVVIAKADAAAPADVVRVVGRARGPSIRARRSCAAPSPVTLDDAAAVRGKRVLVVEDGPTITHGGMPYGAALVAAEQADAARIVDPRPYAAPDIAAVYAQYPAHRPGAAGDGLLARAARSAAPDDRRGRGRRGGRWQRRSISRR